LVQFEKDWLRLESHDETGAERTIKLRLTPQPQKTVVVSGKEYKRVPQTQLLPVVLFEPNHLQILQGSPDGRRAYLDDILEQTKLGYAKVRRDYRRVLAQRNALLKKINAGFGEQDLFPWDVRLSELGAILSRSRGELVASLSSPFTNLYIALSKTTTEVHLQYESRFVASKYETQLLHALEHGRADDILRGFTSYGPHREDMSVLFNGHPAQLVASRGEARTAVLTLKILELETLETATEQRPILLLDDVFSELDGARRRALTAYLQRYQTFLTTTDADVAAKHFTDSTIIPLGND
jgi:DNA replication and repair protein RecF